MEHIRKTAIINLPLAPAELTPSICTCYPSLLVDEPLDNRCVRLSIMLVGP